MKKFIARLVFANLFWLLPVYFLRDRFNTERCESILEISKNNFLILIGYKIQKLETEKQ